MALTKEDCMKKSVLAVLMEFDKHTKPLTPPEMRMHFPPEMHSINMAMGRLVEQKFIKREGERPKHLYQITPLGRKRIKDELEVWPWNERPDKIKPHADEAEGKTKRAYNRRTPNEVVPAAAPLPPPNLSINADNLMSNISVVLEENARMRDALQLIYNQLGAMLNVKPSDES